jgi:chromodomain-helicase-DNA-binding protein 4
VRRLLQCVRLQRFRRSTLTLDLSYHFGCLPATVKADVTRTFKAEAAAEIVLDSDTGSTSSGLRLITRPELDANKTLTLPMCPSCTRLRGTECAYCHTEHPSAVRPKTAPTPAKLEEDSPMSEAPTLLKTESNITIVMSSFNSKALELPEVPPAGILFRCGKCLRAAHYECMPEVPTEDDASDEGDHNMLSRQAEYYQRDWQCPDCDRWTSKVDIILAWKPLGANEDDVLPADIERPTVKDTAFPAEYLIKFEGDSYRHLEWVPHAFRTWLRNCLPIRSLSVRSGGDPPSSTAQLPRQGLRDGRQSSE